MNDRIIESVTLAAALSLLTPASLTAQDQTETQLWGNLTLDRIQNRQVSLGVAIEPKALVSKPVDDPGWASLGVTPSVEYTNLSWLDVTGELGVTRTKQTSNVNSTEITPTLGFRFHILSRLAETYLKEKLPRRRLVLRSYLRFEWRNFYYSDDTQDSSDFRIRNRFESLYPFNRPRVSDNGAIYAIGDAEFFTTTEDLSERFASKQRFRVGGGYRRSYAWRFEALYVWDRSRHAEDGDFVKGDQAVDLRLRRLW
jgi:Protein of unknown function (DUF2490)